MCRGCLISFARPLHPVTCLKAAFSRVFGVLCEQENKALTELNLEYNNIGYVGVSALSHALTVRHRSGCVLRVCLVHTELVCGLIFALFVPLDPR